MEYKVKLQPPLMPDYISTETNPRKRGRGFQDSKISVCELTKEQAEEFGELMKQAFIKHHKERVAMDKNI
jgi:hypothetical protein